MKIYVASSWRNQFQPAAVNELRAYGHEVYDFRNPAPGNEGFHWSEIDPKWKAWSPAQCQAGLNHEVAKSGFLCDYNAMEWADAFVGIEPFGKSASMEMGWAAGNGKPTILVLANGEPELMVKMFDHICLSITEAAYILARLERDET